MSNWQERVAHIVAVAQVTCKAGGRACGAEHRTDAFFRAYHAETLGTFYPQDTRFEVAAPEGAATCPYLQIFAKTQCFR